MTHSNFRIAVRHSNQQVTVWNVTADTPEEARQTVLDGIAGSKGLAPARTALVGFAGGKA